MTDKQIIIDGIDVSGCSYHYKHTRVCLVKMDAAGRYYNCANWHDCDFKKLSQQLKRKEQRIVELNKTIEAKEQECQELKKCYKNNSALLDFEETNTTKLVNKVIKLEQTLTEIKEITQYDVYTPHTDLCIKLNWIKKKISEVEDE